MKKPIHAVIAITMLCTSLFVGCAPVTSSADSQPPTNSMSTQNSTTSGTAANEYADIFSLRTEGYYTSPLRDFNTAIKVKIDNDTTFLSTFSALMEATTPESEDYQFVYETLNYSISEIISPQMGEAIVLSRYLKKCEGDYAGDKGETFYTFMFTALYSVEYRVTDEAALTVQERDELLTAFHTELQNAINAMTKEQVTQTGIKSELVEIADDLCAELSTNALVFENAQIHSIEILDDEQEYQM